MSDPRKPPIAVLSPRFLHEMALAAREGDDKHGVGSWRGVSVHAMLSALLRHALAAVAGEATDRDSGLSPLAHVAVCAMLAYELLRWPGAKDERRWVDGVDDQG